MSWGRSLVDWPALDGVENLTPDEPIAPQEPPPPVHSPEVEKQRPWAMQQYGDPNQVEDYLSSLETTQQADRARMPLLATDTTSTATAEPVAAPDAGQTAGTLFGQAGEFNAPVREAVLGAREKAMGIGGPTSEWASSLAAKAVSPIGGVYGEARKAAVGAINETAPLLAQLGTPAGQVGPTRLPVSQEAGKIQAGAIASTIPSSPLDVALTAAPFAGKIKSVGGMVAREAIPELRVGEAGYAAGTGGRGGLEGEVKAAAQRAADEAAAAKGAQGVPRETGAIGASPTLPPEGAPVGATQEAGAVGAPPAATPPEPPSNILPPPVGGETPPAPHEPPESIGNRYVAPLRPFADVQGEVVGRSNTPVVRQVQDAIAATGINPSLANDTPVGKAITAYGRQQIASDELTKVALTSTLDTHAQVITGRSVLGIDRDGMISLGGAKTPWQDVFSEPGKFALTSKQTAYINDFQQIIREGSALMEEAGIKVPKLAEREGWSYIPRQVENVRGIDLTRRSSPFLQRLYDEAAQGVENGIKYSADPRATAELYLKTAYKAVADKQLGDALEPLSVTATQLVPGPTKSRLIDAINVRRDAETAARKSIQAEAVTAGRAPMPSTFADKVAANPAVSAARSDYQTAKNAYSKAMQSARKSEYGPGSLFGYQEDEIPIGQWRSRFFPKQDAQALNDSVGILSKRPGVVSETVGKAVNLTRFAGTMADFGSAPFIQGLPLLARNPVGWAEATFGHYSTLLNPRNAANFMRDNLSIAQELAQHGVAIGDPEFFSAAEKGGGLPLGKPLEYVPLPGGGNAREVAQNLGTQTVGRSRTAFADFGTRARVILAKAVPDMDPAERAQWVNNMTGGLNSKALGVGATQRNIEGMWLSFSPRLLRSTAALMTDALNPTTQAGRESLRTLAQMAGGAAALYYATGKALGKSDEEIKTGLNPLNGKKFLSYDVGGQWIGPGGQVRSLTQFVANMGATAAGHPGNFSQLNRDNPIVNYWQSRSAPAAQMAETSIDAATRGRTQLNPYEHMNGPVDYLKYLGTSYTPFAARDIAQGGGPVEGLATSIGLRSSPETTGDVENRLAKALGAQDYASASPEIRDQIANNPEVLKTRKEATGNELTPYQQSKTAVESSNPDIQNAKRAVENYQKGVPNAQRLSDYWHDETVARRGIAGSLSNQFADQFAGFSKSKFDKDVQAYYDTVVKTPAGDVDGEATDQARQDWLKGLPADERQWVDEALQVSRDKVAQRDPLHAQYLDYLDQKKQAGYFEPGTKQSVKDALDKAHPELDVAAWKFGANVEGKNPPALNSTRAVEMALGQDEQNFPIRFGDMKRPVNESQATLQAYRASKGPMAFYLDAGGTVNLDAASRDKYGVPFARLTEDDKSGIRSSVKANIRSSDENLDAWLLFWGVIQKAPDNAVESQYRDLLRKYGAQPVK